MKQALESVLAGVDEKMRDPLRNAFMTPANKRTPEQKALLKKHPSVGSFSPGVLYQYNKKHADELKKMDGDIAKIRAQKPVHEYLRSVAESKSKSDSSYEFVSPRRLSPAKIRSETGRD